MSWRADGMQGADGCCAVRWQADGGESAGGTQSARRMLRGKQVDGAQGTGRRGTRRGGEWCAYSQQKVRRDYIWLARAIAHFRKRAIHQVKRVCGP